MRSETPFAAGIARVLLLALGLVAYAAHPAELHAQQSSYPPVAKPPMGWNSWDSYGTTINDSQVKANADWMAGHLKAYGWQYITVDMEWFVKNPKPEGNARDAQYEIDANGRFQPSIERFPSSMNGSGFKPLADYIHSLGLKFGIHVLQGIPREAVQQNLPIAGSAFHAQDAADPSATCRWNFDNYDLKNDAAGQAYYDSLASMYAAWGVDLIKIDCISAGPYKGDEIRMFSAALAKTGRPIVLSLSPGPTPVEKMSQVEQFANMWRISGDIWDIWDGGEDYPRGLNEQFAKTAAWASAPRNGHYPDADMLPLGYLGPAAGWGVPRQTRLSHDEQKTLLALWAISRSPLVMGGSLVNNDDWTTSLLTNREFLSVDQDAHDPRVPVQSESNVVWTSVPDDGKGFYVALFNRNSVGQTMHYSWREIGIPEGKYRVRDLWEHKDLGVTKNVSVTLSPHASALWRLMPLPAN
jgi:alpha-galactosidase